MMWQPSVTKIAKPMLPSSLQRCHMHCDPPHTLCVLLRKHFVHHHFICDFSHHAQLLFNLMGKNAMWVWGESQQAAFNEIKHTVTLQLVLAFANDS